LEGPHRSRASEGCKPRPACPTTDLPTVKTSVAGVTVTAKRTVSADRRLRRGHLATSRLAAAARQKQRRASGARWEPPTSDRMTPAHAAPADQTRIEHKLMETPR
jgi:hypothetical protein